MFQVPGERECKLSFQANPKTLSVTNFPSLTPRLLAVNLFKDGLGRWWVGVRANLWMFLCSPSSPPAPPAERNCVIMQQAFSYSNAQHCLCKRAALLGATEQPRLYTWQWKSTEGQSVQACHLRSLLTHGQHRSSTDRGRQHEHNKTHGKENNSICLSKHLCMPHAGFHEQYDIIMEQMDIVWKLRSLCHAQG